MTTLVLTAAASAISGAAGLGSTASAFLSAGAAIAGRAIDTALLSRPTVAEGPRLDVLEVTTSSEGVAVPRVFGRIKVAGHLIWATNFEEVRTKETTGGSGKGAPKTTTVTYSYFANMALALAEGPVAHIGRVWADGEELPLDEVQWRFYPGDETQQPDPLIESKEGAGGAPAYLGISYVVFERLPLKDFGNRLPQLAFEIYRPVAALEQAIRAVDIIPGAGEFAYDTQPVRRQVAKGEFRGENKTGSRAGSDWTASLDELQALCPNLSNAALVVTWFGTDLRAGHCRFEPRIDSAAKITEPQEWSVSGLPRDLAQTVSTYDGGPAFGGTPSDAGVVRSLKDLRARGIGAMFYPFVMMDIPPGSGRADPHGGAEQPAYPWRGRITCDPAPGSAGSPDQTAAAATQIAMLVGAATPADFTISGDTVIYSGPDEWTLRRMTLHYAALCAAAGGVDAFVIASELVGLTMVRNSVDSFPFVEVLKALAADVRSIVGPDTKIGYAADWSEYHSYRPDDGSGDVYFNLDPLWADPNIDFVGIDNYLPLTDWRDGSAHLDMDSGYVSSKDTAYLAANVEGGEYFAWYYESDADRREQVRTPITDGSYGKPWVFRQKDIRSWWSEPHLTRSGGVEGAVTDWVPRSKPIWFTEIGCPAVDKGANQPNVFIDPKSSESAAPYFSAGSRDDIMQRRMLDAVLGHWANNAPVSPVYGGSMIPVERVYVWAWDARAFPAFPADTSLWADALNWDRGHWLNGRLGTAPIDELVPAILSHFPAPAVSGTGTAPAIDGYVIDRVMSARDALDPIEHAFAVDIRESGGELVISSRLAPPACVLRTDELVEGGGAGEPESPLVVARAQESDLASIARVSVAEPFDSYRRIAAEARLPDGAFDRVASSELPMVMATEQAQTIAEQWLYASRGRRERARFALPPSRLSIEPGDSVAIDVGGVARRFHIESVSEDGLRTIEAVSADRAPYHPAPPARRDRIHGQTSVSGAPRIAFLDLPLLSNTADDGALYVAGHAVPWKSGLAVYRSPEDAGFVLKTVIETPAILGETLDKLAPGRLWLWDDATILEISISSGTLSSIPDALVLAGGNVLAVDTGAGFEVLQFANAELIGNRRYRLSRLLRGQLGSDRVMSGIVAAGAPLAVLNADIAVMNLSSSELGVAANWRIGLADRPFDDPSFVTVSHVAKGEGRRPLSPVHLRTRRDAETGDVTVAWIRRTRRGGDGWEQADVPLAEETETYLVTIRDMAGAIAMTAQTHEPVFVFSSSQQASGFGGVLLPGDALDFQVQQVSATFGPGAALRRMLYV